MSGAGEMARALRAVLPLPWPVDVGAFCAAIGAQYGEDELEPGVLGLTFVRRRRWIVVRRGAPAAARRLAVLHLGGHVVLGHRDGCVFVVGHERLWRFARERAACEFAVQYGIPDELVAGVGWADVAGAALQSGLPYEVAELRLGLAQEHAERWAAGPRVRELRRPDALAWGCAPAADLGAACMPQRRRATPPAWRGVPMRDGARSDAGAGLAPGVGVVRWRAWSSSRRLTAAGCFGLLKRRLKGGTASRAWQGCCWHSCSS